MKTSITKILDIDNVELSKVFIDKLLACECYEDKINEQHLYNSWDFLNDEEGLFEDVFNAKDIETLEEIERLCITQECDYFRITY